MAAFSALLRRGATTYNLTVADSFSPPSLAADVSVAGGSGTTTTRLVQELVGKPAQMQVPLLIQSASQAALVTALNDLDAYLRLGECTLEVMFTDAATATIWTVHHAQPVQPMFTNIADLGHWTKAALDLLVSPFVVTTPVDLYDDEAVTSPDSVGLSSMAGNYRSPLSIEVIGTSVDIHSLYLAIDPADSDNYMLQGKDLTWGAGETDTTDAAAYSGTAAYVRSATSVTAPIDTSAYSEGPYLILARVKIRNSKTGYITTDYTPDTISFTRGTFHIVELGRCYLPTRKVRNAAAANLTVSLRSSTATAGDEACLDWVYLLPVGNGMFSYHPLSDTEDATAIYRDAEFGLSYIDNAVNEQNITGSTLMTLGGRLLVVSETVAGTAATQAVTVSVAYTPRYAWMR